MIINGCEISLILKSKNGLAQLSHFSGEYENQESPGSRFPGGTIGPAEEDFHEPCTPEPLPGPQMPGHPAGAAHRKEW